MDNDFYLRAFLRLVRVKRLSGRALLKVREV
jgi:hypothetical protein